MMAQATTQKQQGAAMLPAAPEGVRLGDAFAAGCGELLSSDALSLVAMLQRRFAPTGHMVHADNPAQEDWPVEGQALRNADWFIGSATDGDAIPGHVTRIKAETAGLANAPCLARIGSNILRDHKAMQLAAEKAPTRPGACLLALDIGGWDAFTEEMLVDGKPVVTALFNSGLHLWLAHEALAVANRPVLFCLQGIETPAQARLWSDVFTAAAEALDLSAGAIRVVLVLNTRNAAFRAEELLFELKDHVFAVLTGNEKYLPVLADIGRRRQVQVMADEPVSADALSACVPHDGKVEAQVILAAFAC